MNKRTTSITTIGPASSSHSVTAKLIRAGMDAARLTLSHGDWKDHRNRIRREAIRTGRQIAIIQDLQGPKLRVGAMRNDGVLLKRGDTVTLTAINATGTGAPCERKATMYNYATSAVLLVLFVVTNVMADEKNCKSLDEIENYWKLQARDAASESAVKNLCLQNRQALGLLEGEEKKKEKKKPAKPGPVDDRKQCAREYLLSINELCGKFGREFGLYHLEEAIKAAKLPGEEEATEEHRKSARQYLGDAAVEQALPEMITLKPRQQAYEFSLKKGEQTSSWIQGEVETTNHLHFFETSNNAFEIRYKNGDVIKGWAGEKVPKFPNGPFKIVATEDTTVLIMVD